MQTTATKPVDTKIKTETPKKDDSPKPKQDEKTKKTYNISTPRNFLQKSTTADIYGQKKKTTTPTISNTKAPKKSSNTSYLTSVSPMKGLLNSSPSSISSISVRSESKMASAKKTDPKTSKFATPRRDFNVTVNSPIVKRKLNLDRERSFVKEVPVQKKEIKNERVTSKTERLSSKNEKVSSKIDRQEKISEKLSSKVEKSNVKVDNVRVRSKTRTLNENEVKILTSEVVDNNSEMYNLTRKLSAKPKAFFVDLDHEKAEKQNEEPQVKAPSDDDVSYEDDFESYESDFDSYHSSSPGDDNGDETDDKNEQNDDDGDDQVEIVKEVRDEEKMLDSGSFDLRDRSANKSKPVLDFIIEASEGGGEKPSSLTDEGFQEMSSSSAVSSMKTVHTDVVEKPLFIDFTKSKESKRKKRTNDKLKQRAKDLLSIITLHEMSYTLFEMKPISYDLYMATFGRSNYTQVAVQTFDDGNTVEVQTDEIEEANKWTQHPVEFTKNDICIQQIKPHKQSNHTESILTKFTFFNNVDLNLDRNNLEIDDDYKNNPLRIYFEQKDGAGDCEMLPYETYKNKLKNKTYNTQRLGKFLKKIERRISNVLYSNSGNTQISGLKMTKLPFSKGYLSISSKNITDKNISFLNNTNVLKVYFSETKTNYIMTVHDKAQSYLNKCLICLWDISVARQEPLKILAAIDNVAIGKFRGATDGYFIGALEDGSLHLWDLTEKATWRDVANEENSKDLVDIDKNEMTQFELDREWNLKNSRVGLETSTTVPLQISAYTSSAYNMCNNDVTDQVVGLEFIGTSQVAAGQESGRKIVGQIMCLQRVGILTIWSLVQEKTKAIPPDIGKAYWSKVKLEKYQKIPLQDHIDPPIDNINGEEKTLFNLNAAKRRLVGRKQERRTIKRQNSRPKSAISNFDSDRPVSAASVKNKSVLPAVNSVDWDSGIMCYDLKVMSWKNGEYYLVAKNCGEVLYCRKILGVVKVSKLCVASNASSITCIETSPHKLPYYLAASDTGTIALCSLNEDRVLLKLDCRNISVQDKDRTQVDHKGRFISSVTERSHGTVETRPTSQITSIAWPLVNPCSIYVSLLDGTALVWDLAQSDIYAHSSEATAVACATVDSTLALLTPNADVQIHKLVNENKMKEFKHLFEKYVALL